ncbi:MAG: 23S rRNA (adenine(2503)-C(2))-methyltransferase RlmN [Oscillospiraceae bacterium]|nr:23S rRNA (adenine(2503)-C(2))-methyltransferase RlmN [Oscillospiraceae bacterium]
MEKNSISSFTEEALCDYIKGFGQPAFRGKQLFKWLHQKRVTQFSQMTDIPKALIEKLEENSVIDTLTIRKKQIGGDGTIKYLFALADGNCVEAVVMRYEYGNTICVSTQVGCRMGCRFCASTQGGLVRSLTAGEICAEVYTAQADVDGRISNIVLMGIGEPLDNYNNVMDFLTIISSDNGINIGMRNITLSTCGLVPMIDELAQRKLGITLAISLHGPTDEIRSGMMPINNKYNVDELIAACRRYQHTTGRRVSFEYAMVNGVNDSADCAKQLSTLLKGMGAHVNLIPINPVDGSAYSATDAKNVSRFKERLEVLGINATVRRRLGTDISAACGQLRREESTKAGE